NKTLGDVWAQTNNPNLNRPFAGFYGPEARLNLMIGIESGWNGAQDAYDYLWPFIGVNIFWDSVTTGRVPDLAERAGWAIDFYPATSTATTKTMSMALAGPGPIPAQLLTPALGEAFSSSVQSFTWTAGTGVTAYKLDLGTTQG